MPDYMHIDIETYSSVDLEKCGVYKYAESEDFEILLFAYTFNNDPVRVLDLTKEALPWFVLVCIKVPNIIKVAHTAMVERICLSSYL